MLNTEIICKSSDALNLGAFVFLNQKTFVFNDLAFKYFVLGLDICIRV